MSRNILRRGIVASLTVLFALIPALLGQPIGLDTGLFSKTASGVPTTPNLMSPVIANTTSSASTIVNGLGSAQGCAGGAFNFSTGAPDGRMGSASRPAGSGVEIETADDFILSQPTTITGATITGLLPSGALLSTINFVGVELYHVFPVDSTVPPSGMVPSRVNSPSDNAFDSRDSLAGDLSFTAALAGPFSVANTVVNGISTIPTQTTMGEGPATGEEVFFNITFTTPFVLPPNHYFFKPTVGLTSGDFLWLSTTTPPLFTGDLQSWIRNTSLDPDWLRIGTDIVGGATPPKFNEAFSLSGAFTTCLQDDSNPANVVIFNAQTGQYTFCCGGQVFTGVGIVRARGCTVTIQDFSAGRRVQIGFDASVKAGSALLQSPPGNTRCTITDRNTANNTCACL